MDLYAYDLDIEGKAGLLHSLQLQEAPPYNSITSLIALLAM